MDIFTEIKESLRLKALREFTTEELLAEIRSRKRMSEIIYQDDNILVIAIDDKDRNYTYSVIRKPLEKAVSSATQKMSSGMPAILHPKCIQSAVSSAVPLQTGIDGSVDINKMPNNALLSIIAHRDEIMLKDTEARILANRDEAQEKA